MYSSQHADFFVGHFYLFFSIDANTTLETEPKFIVFYSMLLNLFSLFCFKCRFAKPEVHAKRNGTMVTITQDCPKCGEAAYKWRSQPLILGSYPAGNVLLSFGVLMAGASISKVLLVLRHMGLSVMNARTFFRHQSNFLFPAILKHWESFQDTILGKIKGMQHVEWCGDGRFDSMGHSAKYGAYSMFCTAVNKIVHIELLQVIFKGPNMKIPLVRTWSSLRVDPLFQKKKGSTKQRAKACYKVS